MALTEDEQRLLSQLESELAHDDPHLASVLRGTPHVVVNRRGALLGGFGLLAGLALLVAGMSTFWVISILGFLVMLAATVITFRAYSVEADEEAPAVVTTLGLGSGSGAAGPRGAHVARPGAGGLGRQGARVPRGADPASRQRDFMAAMEEQWRRRQEEQGR